MDLQFRTIQLRMTVYGGLIGALGGAILGAGFVALTYNPFYEMNILLMMVGALATMLVGGGFGLLTGLMAGVAVSVLTNILFKNSRFKVAHKVVAGCVSVSVTLFVFFPLAYSFGRPFIWDTQTYPSWLWAMVLSVIGALIVSTLSVNAYISQHSLKLKPAVARVRVDK